MGIFHLTAAYQYHEIRTIVYIHSLNESVRTSLFALPSKN